MGIYAVPTSNDDDFLATVPTTPEQLVSLFLLSSRRASGEYVGGVVDLQAVDILDDDESEVPLYDDDAELKTKQHNRSILPGLTTPGTSEHGGWIRRLMSGGRRGNEHGGEPDGYVADCFACDQVFWDATGDSGDDGSCNGDGDGDDGGCDADGDDDGGCDGDGDGDDSCCCEIDMGAIEVEKDIDDGDKDGVAIRLQACSFGSKCTGIGSVVPCCVPGCVSVSHHICRIQHCDESHPSVDGTGDGAFAVRCLAHCDHC